MEHPTEAEIKNWQRGVLIRKWVLGLSLAFVVVGVITLVALQSSKQKPDVGVSGIDEGLSTNRGSFNSSVNTPSPIASPSEEKSFSFVAPGQKTITGHIYPNAQKPNGKMVLFTPLLDKSDGNLYNASLHSLWSVYGKKRGLFQLADAQTKFDSGLGGNAVCWDVSNPNELFCVFPVKDSATGSLAALHIWLE